MTVNELITELQVLVAQGHGDLDVVSSQLGDCGEDTTLLSLEFIEMGKDSHCGYYRLLPNWKEIEHWDKTELIKDRSYIYLQASLCIDDN